MIKISKEIILNRFVAENPWWDNSSSIPFREYRQRPFFDLLFPLIVNKGYNRAIVLLGPRRVGKTVLIHQVIRRLVEQEKVSPKKIAFFAVDHPLFDDLSLEEFLALYTEQTGIDYHTEGCYFFFDEIQYQNGWEKQLKILVDRLPGSRLVVSGSAAAALKKKSDESGAGRFSDFLLPALSFYEYLYLLGKTDLVGIDERRDGEFHFHADRIRPLNEAFLSYINFGGYPEAVFSKEIRSDPGRFIKSDIIDKVLSRDLPVQYGINDTRELSFLFSTLVFNTGNELSLDALSQNSGVAKSTIKKYLEYLEAAFLIQQVHRVDRNAKRFMRANFFKVYLTNPSIRTALFSPFSPDDPAAGALVETAIVSQWFSWRIPLYYARWNTGEVDMVALDELQKIRWLCEVKWSDRYVENVALLKNVIDICLSHNIKKATVTTISQWGIKETHNVTLGFLPASLYAFITGFNAHKGIPSPPEAHTVSLGRHAA